MDSRPTSPFEQQLTEVLYSGDFERLNSYQHPSSWTTLSISERSLLGRLFAEQGKRWLLMGNIKGLELFDRAITVAPNEASLFHELAAAYGMQKHHPRCLSLAVSAAEKATQLQPTSISFWIHYGELLTQLGSILEEEQHLQQAIEKFKQANFLLKSSPEANGLLMDLYWKWGRAHFYLGGLSGEAQDFHQAQEYYRQSAHLGIDDAIFWSDYGDVMRSLAELLNQPHLYHEVADLFRKAVRADSELFHGWYSLGIACRLLYEHNHEDSYYNMAEASFAKAAELRADAVDLWYHWAQLIMHYARITQDLDKLDSCLEKFDKASACDPTNAEVLAKWGEAQLFLAGIKEDFNLMRASEGKFVKSLELNPDQPNVWCLYGMCLKTMGLYFSDTTFYRRAIEKFQYGLYLNPNHQMLWFALGELRMILGEAESDVTLIEEAMQAYAKAVECVEMADPEIWMAWGIAWMHWAQLKDDAHGFELALEKFEKAIDICTSHGEEDLTILYHYGCAFDLLGDHSEDPRDYERAVQTLSHVVEQDPGYTVARYNLASALLHLGETLRAVEPLQQALAHYPIIVQNDPEEDPIWSDWGLTLLTLAHIVHDPVAPELSQNLLLEADQKLRHAVNLGNSEAYYHLACVCAIQGNVLGAIEYLRKSEMLASLPKIEELLGDHWLDPVKDTEEFRRFLDQVASRGEESST